MRFPINHASKSRVVLVLLTNAAFLALAATFFRSLWFRPSPAFFISWFGLLSISMFACLAFAVGLEKVFAMRRFWSHFISAVILAALFVTYQAWRVLVYKPQTGFDVDGVLLPTVVLSLIVSMTTLIARRLGSGRGPAK